MPGTSVLDEIELIIEDIGGGGGKQPPSGGDGGDGDKNRQPGRPAHHRFSTAILLAIASIVMFFATLTAAFIVLKVVSTTWRPLHLPGILWVNTVVLLTSSVTLELARRRLATSDVSGFGVLWRVTTLLGVLFLVGQVIAWRQLVLAGVFIASNQASSFFYIFTGAHGLHLMGGILALLYVAFRQFESAKVSRKVAAQVASYYWHFMDGLWLLLLALLYVGTLS
jgi:cytochrome c oxidase subunit III